MSVVELLFSTTVSRFTTLDFFFLFLLFLRVTIFGCCVEGGLACFAACFFNFAISAANMFGSPRQLVSRGDDSGILESPSDPVAFERFASAFRKLTSGGSTGIRVFRGVLFLPLLVGFFL